MTTHPPTRSNGSIPAAIEPMRVGKARRITSTRAATVLVGVAAALMVGCANQAPPSSPAAKTAEAACGKPVLLSSGQLARSVSPGRWVTLKELEASFPKAPMDVGFDIDDTLIFPSAGFQAVLNGTAGSGGPSPYGADRRAVVANPKTWNDLHHLHDGYALPKMIGRELLALHKQRGDRIHLITARAGVEAAPLEARMRKMFDIEFAGPIVFTSLKSKTESIRARKLALYYGDSDSDIEYAKEAGIRGVRVLRATNAIDYDRPPCFGKFGEEVIIDSDR